MTIGAEYKLVPAYNELKEEVIVLLNKNNLPVSDLDETKHLFALMRNNEVCGTGGFEFFDAYALLRSVSVRRDLQGKGLGKFINQELEKISRKRGVAVLYLLTTTAKDFFKREGYEVMKRDDAPESIKNTSEFSAVCSSTAILMRKELV